MLLDVFDGIAYSCDLLGVLIGNLNVESLLELHDELNGIERVCSQVTGETCFGSNLRLLYTCLLYTSDAADE